MSNLSGQITADDYKTSGRQLISEDAHSHRRNASSRHEFQDPLKLFARAATKLYSLWVCTVYPFARCGRKLSLHFTCDVRNPALIAFGNSVIVHKDVWLHGVPSDQNEDTVTLTVGDNCLIGRRSHITARNQIDIGSDVIVSAGVLIQDHGHAYQDINLPISMQGIAKGGRIQIGQGSWIGQGAAIVCSEGELTIGHNCIVAANAVVTKSVAAYSIVSGNPARVVKQYDQVKGSWVLGSASPSVVIPRKAEEER